MKENKYSFLTKNIFLFAVAGVLPKLISFFLVPIYTNILTTTEYGYVDLVNTTIQLLLPVFTLTIHDAVMRFSFDDAYSKKHVFSTSIWIIINGTFFVFIGTLLLRYLGFINISFMYCVYMIGMFFLNAIQQSVTRFCRSINKVNTVAISGIINSIVTFIMNIMLLVVLEYGVNGYLCAHIMGNVASLIFFAFSAKLYKYITIRIPLTTIIKMIKFSFPMIFSALAWWINNASDRYIITLFLGVETSAIYAIANKIPTILAMFQNVFYQAWSISAIKDYDKTDSDGFIGNVCSLLDFVMVSACSFVMLLNIPLAKILYSNDFYAAWKYVPPLLISIVMNAISLFYDSILLAAKDTKTISISTVSGAIINTILNIILIPLYGAYGAAIATLLGYGLGLIYRIVLSRKHIRMKIDWNREIFGFMIISIQMILGFWGMRFIVLQIVCFTIIMFLYRSNIFKTINFVKNRLRKAKS